MYDLVHSFTVPVLLPQVDQLPGLVLRVCLNIVLTGKGMEKVWLLPAKEGEPVLLCQGALHLILLHHLQHLDPSKLLIVLLASSHPGQVVQHHPSVKPLTKGMTTADSTYCTDLPPPLPAHHGARIMESMARCL